MTARTDGKDKPLRSSKENVENRSIDNTGKSSMKNTERKPVDKSLRTPVRLKITGLQTGEEKTDPVVLIVRGEYYCKKDVHYIFYTEYGEGGEETRNRLTFRQGQVELRKQGAGRSLLAFETGRKRDCHYHTVVGPMRLVSDTRRIHWEEETGRRRLHMEYSLLMNDQLMSDNVLVLEMTFP